MCEKKLLRSCKKANKMNYIKLRIKTLPSFRIFFFAGRRHGIGTLFYRNGSKYEGNFEYGIEKGFGKLTDLDGIITEGNFENGEVLGYVKITYPSRNIRRGYRSGKLWKGRVDFVEHKDGTTWNEEWNDNSFSPDIKLIKLSKGGEVRPFCFILIV